MLFLITQTHTPDNCPVDEGGPSVLYDAQAEGVTLRAVYRDFSGHVAYYVVEADSLKAIDRFLLPGFKRCTCNITPVGDDEKAV